ncbi:MAG: hypothetical protein J6I96_05610 [Oscillospiraceae bacterium]|nr:hypothetical protein [Oscillospiraceae bacterium]
MKGKVMKMRAEQDALEQRMKTEGYLEEIYRRGEELGLYREQRPAELRSDSFERKHPRNKDGTFAPKGLTGDDKSIKISNKESKAIDNILRSEWYIYKDKKKALITPYGCDHEYLIRIKGFRDFDVLQKYEIKPRGGE